MLNRSYHSESLQKTNRAAATYLVGIDYFTSLDPDLEFQLSAVMSVCSWKMNCTRCELCYMMEMWPL